MNKRNGGNIGIGCGNNGSRSNGTSNFQRPIISCLNEAKDQQHQHQQQQQQHQHQQNHNYNVLNVNHMLHAQNQQHQVNVYCHSKYRF